VLTDSVLIVYDESAHPTSGHYTFDTQHFMLSAVTVDFSKEDEITITNNEESRKVSMIMRGSEHKKEWVSIFKSVQKDAKDAYNKCGIKSDDISFDMDENMGD